MNAGELERIDELFRQNKRLSGYSEGNPRGDRIAMIATVVEMVREEIKASKPIVEDRPNESGKVSAAQVSIDVFLPQDRLIHTALFSLGCEDLTDITGWRKMKSREDLETTPFQIRIKGRYATMPAEAIGIAEINRIGEKMKKYGLSFQEDCSI